ncbi:ethionine resistance protein [Coemansia sp. RSA 455]|nr:ethionine resistance protein [Coemansia sp. RSA 922]KAJ2256270.1 ethionine resistance protein [Coemansia sp. RSA 455]KAJ2468081.1 ethionine resistance protein [Coemansia sp. RSA 2337]
MTRLRVTPPETESLLPRASTETTPLISVPSLVEGGSILTASGSGSTTTTLSGEYFEHDSASTNAVAGQEAVLIMRSSVPLALSSLLQSSFHFINILSLGHLGANELAAAALANMTLFMLINAPSVGLASALTTFCATAFTASPDKTLVGFHLQCGLIAVTVHFLIVLPILLNIESILLALNQDVVIASLCSKFVHAQLVGSLAWIYFECVKRFLQAQGHMKASTYVLLAVLPIHLANTYLLVWSPMFGVGFLGAALANVITFFAMLAGIIVYVWCTEARQTWGGWTRQSIFAMPQYYRLAIPSTVMMCSEWAAWELMAIAASYLGNVTLAGQSIVINTCSLTYQVPGGLIGAVSNRVGNLLGQSRARRANISATVGLLLGGLAGTIGLTFYVGAASWWGRLYSNDPDVITTVALIMPVCALFQFADALSGMSGGILRSLGRQTIGAWINLPSYYVVGLPLGLYLTYGAPSMGVVGLWIGITVAATLTSFGQSTICLAANYAKEVDRCMAQVNKSRNIAANSAEDNDDTVC